MLRDLLARARTAARISGTRILPSPAPRQVGPVPMAGPVPIDLTTFREAIRANHERICHEVRGMASGWFSALPTSLATAATASLLAHALKPYGPGSAGDLDSMLASPTLDCSNFGMFAIHTARQIDPLIAREVHFRIVGWESKAIGNHGMLFAELTSRPDCVLLLDPTVGLVAQCSFDHVASRRRVRREAIISFRQQPLLDGSRWRLIEALRHGLICPSELLYFFESEQHLCTGYGEARTWPTPGAMRWRDKNLPETRS